METFENQKIIELVSAVQINEISGNILANASVRGIINKMQSDLLAVRKLSSVANAVLVKKPDATRKVESSTLLEVEIIEEKEEIDSSKVVRVIQAISEIHEKLAKVYQIDNAKVDLAFIDSGSDVNFGFKLNVELSRAIVEVVEKAQDLFLFSGNVGAERNMKTVVDAMEAFKGINDAVKKGLLNEEEAKIFKEQIISCMRTLALNRVVIKSREPKEAEERRNAILRGSRQLLLGVSDSGANVDISQ